MVGSERKTGPRVVTKLEDKTVVCVDSNFGMCRLKFWHVELSRDFPVPWPRALAVTFSPFQVLTYISSCLCDSPVLITMRTIPPVAFSKKGNVSISSRDFEWNIDINGDGRHPCSLQTERCHLGRISKPVQELHP